MHTECHTGDSWHGLRLERTLGRSQATDKTQGAETRCPGDTALPVLRGDRRCPWFTYERRSQKHTELGVNASWLPSWTRCVNSLSLGFQTRSGDAATSLTGGQ